MGRKQKTAPEACRCGHPRSEHRYLFPDGPCGAWPDGCKAYTPAPATPEEEPQDRDGHTCPCPHPVGHPACGCGSPEGEQP
jgi:hypothetical protein